MCPCGSRWGVLAVLPLVLTACAIDVAAPELVGRWGGEHAELTVALDGSTLAYDCASGTIVGRIAPDRHGNFTVSGVHVFEHGGPMREGEVPDAHPARYDGWTDGARMRLQVTVTDTGQVLGPFDLRLGRAATLVRCL